MSHVDEGTLHAYLDGELPAALRDEVAAHLAGCTACRTRLDEERAVIARARDLLGRAAPPRPIREPAPARARRPGRWPALRIPLAWAATLVLAFAVGWYAQGERGGARVMEPGTPVSRAQDRIGARRDNAPAPAPPSATNSTVRQEAKGRLDADSVRLVLGQAPAVLPGRPVLRTAVTAGAAGVVVEQELGPGTIIRLYESRAGGIEADRGAAPTAASEAAQRAPAAVAMNAKEVRAERLARYVGSLRVEITGPLGTDSLEKLLEQVK